MQGFALSLYHVFKLSRFSGFSNIARNENDIDRLLRRLPSPNVSY